MITVQDKDLDLPIQIIDPRSMTIQDEEMLLAFAEHPPASKFHHGDLAYLTRATSWLRMKETLPRMWQIRFVISTWQYELMRLIHSGDVIHGIDHAQALISAQTLDPFRYSKPYIYAHAFPHGMYPDSAAWFPERALRRVALKDQSQSWVRILDEANAPFMGFDDSGFMAPYTFDMAPDLYSQGNDLRHPFSFEEATTHTAALLGLEEVMFRPVDSRIIGSRAGLDPDHDIFVEK